MMRVELEFDWTRLELENSYSNSTRLENSQFQIFKLELELEA